MSVVLVHKVGFFVYMTLKHTFLHNIGDHREKGSPGKVCV